MVMILSRFPGWIQTAVWLCLMAVAPGFALAGENNPKPKSAVRLEVEAERGTDLDRLTVYICNDTKDDVSFFTGAAGGPGSLDDRVKRVFGTAPTVLPELMFSDDGRSVVVRPPSFEGSVRRSMAPEKLTVKPGQRFMYASFAVPHAYVSGEFVSARLPLLDERANSADKKTDQKSPMVRPGVNEIRGFQDDFIEKKSPEK